jgi:hypothetical protein
MLISYSFPKLLHRLFPVPRAGIGVKLRRTICCQYQKTGNIQQFVIKYFTAKAAIRLRGYLIRLTREYTDGGMDSHADEN